MMTPRSTVTITITDVDDDHYEFALTSTLEWPDTSDKLTAAQAIGAELRRYHDEQLAPEGEGAVDDSVPSREDMN